MLTAVYFAQQVNIDFNSPKNIRKFADFLYCDKDYLRAAAEYQRLAEFGKNDTLDFKIALSYSYIKDYRSAIKNFSQLNSSSSFFNEAKLEKLKVIFLMNDFDALRYEHNNFFRDEVNRYRKEGERLFNFSYLFTDEELPSKDRFLSPFDFNQDKISSFYEWKKDPPFKSSTVAGIMSAIIPGGGKIYVGEIGDGIVAFLTTAVFTYIAYDNFKAGHNTRAWIWTGVAALFYSGNIYGSVAAAQVYNAKMTFEFNEELNVFLQGKNYFAPEYEFCN
jgi:TM2 domain-containing membrane protein YozV